jgi:hypothetical protein
MRLRCCAFVNNLMSFSAPDQELIRAAKSPNVNCPFAVRVSAVMVCEKSHRFHKSYSALALSDFR